MWHLMRNAFFLLRKSFDFEILPPPLENFLAMPLHASRPAQNFDDQFSLKFHMAEYLQKLVL